MPNRRRTPEGFGVRLRQIRRSLGLSQTELAAAIDSTQRTISNYETGIAAPTAGVLILLAKSLNISTDELLGLRKTKTLPPVDAATTRLWNRFQQIRSLPESEQRAVFKMLDLALKGSSRRDGNGSP